MTAGPILLLCALRQELALLTDSLERADESNVGPVGAIRGYLDAADVVLATSGVGKVNAAVVTAQLVASYQPTALVVTGVAGGLDPELNIGDVVVGERTIQHDAGVLGPSGLEPHQAGHVPFFNPSDRLGWQPSDQLLDAARRAVDRLELAPLAPDAGGTGQRPRILFGTILTGDQFVQDEPTRERLRRQFGALAVEMEGAAIAQAAELLGVECLVVRAVSDLAGAQSPVDFGRFLADVAANSASVVRALVGELA